MFKLDRSCAPLTLVALFALASGCVAIDNDVTTTADPSDTGGAGSDASETGGEGSTGATSPTSGTSPTGSEGETSDGEGSVGESSAGSEGGTDSGETGSSGESGEDSSSSGEPGEPGTPVELGEAGDFVILAKSGISTVPKSAVTGDLGVSPAASTYITGFDLELDPSGTFATSTQVTGSIFAATYDVPTPTKLTTAVGDMQLAFTDASARAPDVIELGAGDIGGLVLAPGVYKWGTGLLIPIDVTLEGSADDVWIFQIAQDLTVGDSVEISLSGGALPRNIFWQVDGAVTFGTAAHVEGVVLAQTSVTMETGASLNGRLLAQTAVTLDASTVVEPGQK